MNDTPTDLTSPEVEQPPMKSLLVSFRFSGRDNGVLKEGFDSRVLSVPEDVMLATAADLKAVSDALATSEFNAERRYTGLEITLLNVIKLPI